jgi:hypothetical protein
VKPIKPVYLLAGVPHSRRESRDPLIQRMIEETARLKPSVAYIGVASGDDLPFFRAIKALLVQTAFQRPDMPFYFVEIAPFRYGNDPSALGELRAAQARVASTVPHTGMIHTLDNPNDIANIHPQNKPQTGARLARLALAGTYGVNVGKSICVMPRDFLRLLLTYQFLESG